EITITTKAENRPQVETKLRWDPETLGLYTEARLFHDRKVKPGDTLDYLYFLPSFNQVFRLHVVVKGHEEVKLLSGESKRLLRVEKQVTEKIEGSMLPPEVNWLDDQGEPVKRLMQIQGIGPTTFFRTSEEVARVRPTTPPVDISVNQIVHMSRIIPRS